MSPVNAYVETLKRELPLIVRHLAQDVELEHLHWGGGTPTLLPPDAMTDLAQTIFSVIPLASDAQFSVEIDPSEIDDARMDALAAAGMNRASIGVQDFDPEIQKTIGREQSYETTQQAVDGLRARGINSLNMDILYGLPHQTSEKISDSVGKVLSLSPDRVALYGYAHVPWMAKRQNLIPTESLPSPHERLDLFEVSSTLFADAGYHAIGIDHFALPDDGLAVAHRNGTMRRNFQGYTEDSSDVLIGVGASAISRYPQGYAQNAPSTSAYQGAVRAGDLATTRGHRFTDEDIIRGRLIECLMCDFSLDLAQLAADLNQPITRLRGFTAGLAAEFPGMIEDDGNTLTIRSEAKPLTRMIARALDAYAVSQTGHSHAV